MSNDRSTPKLAPEIANAMQQELQGIDFASGGDGGNFQMGGKKRKGKRGKGGINLKMRQALELVRGRFPHLEAELKGPNGRQLMESMVGVDGSALEAMERGRAMKRLGAYRDPLEERAPLKAPSLDEFDL